ncbi:hypothetical protein ASPVEDRAFT_150369 [Aspergillus versicolor CBS 583.65]|uniref:Protein ZIP4 homolog n=1 Tax=Aspergillus versicolor CBS 583.65 TaxID=1036611 RepID=A0A1L9PJC5_ASPVE|nr:uncharacterized protein ASPVEDRAFT_150369 [Aspergillus versicolor CBS 583.65]OJJ01545.1 hypothetical protein ASPVEDRAFT_150369 [Aspergillus versicolor CBS 583.65]
MAVNDSAKSKDQAQAVLALAIDLQDQLTQHDASDKPTLSRETQKLLERTLPRLPLLAEAASKSTRQQLDNEGAKLWNIHALRMRDTKKKNNNEKVLLCKVKALAYAMLEAAAPKTGPGNYRCLELAFKAAKTCIEYGLTDLSQNIMESAAARLDLMKAPEVETDIVKLEFFSTEYYMLRIYLAWSQGRPDIADHLFSKAPEAKTTEQERVLVDTCYRIGEAALLKCEYNTATTWLSRALAVCELWPGGGQGLNDKKLLVFHAYARSNLYATTASSESQLRKALSFLRTEHGNSFPVLIFSLEVLNKKGEFNEEYFETLKASIKEMNSCDTSVKIVYHYITKIGSSSLEHFFEASEQLLNKLATLGIDSKDQWMEKIFVSVIWVLTNTTSNEDHPPDRAETAAQILAECGLDKPSGNVTQASLILIWKYIDTMLSKGSTFLAEKWCQFILKHSIFQNTPDAEAKYFRKLAICALENYSPSTARKIFDEIPEVCRSCPLILYLVYRLALLAGDASLCTIYIKSLCKSGADSTYVWSCVEDALQLGKMDIAIQSLQDVMVTSNDGDLERLHIPQLLQCVICTAHEMSTANCEDFLGHVTSLLGSALATAAAAQGRAFFSDEIRWFACKSYNIALELYKQSSIQAAVKLLDISTKFMELEQKKTESESNTDTLQHYLKCTFLQSIIIANEARREKGSAKKGNYYRETSEAIKQFKTHIQSLGIRSISITNPPYPWIDKYRIILSLDFEATVFLRQWEDLAKIIEASKPVISAKLSSVFLDCLLRSGAPSSYLSQFVKQMIRTFHSSPSQSITTESTGGLNSYLPRHLRCLFSLSIQAEEYILAESVLDQALILARDGPNSIRNTRAPYPKDELQWLATTAFNRAVEFFLVSADGECRRWAGKAIALADSISGDDGSELGRLLRRNLAKLRPV